MGGNSCSNYSISNDFKLSYGLFSAVSALVLFHFWKSWDRFIEEMDNIRNAVSDGFGNQRLVHIIMYNNLCKRDINDTAYVGRRPTRIGVRPEKSKYGRLEVSDARRLAQSSTPTTVRGSVLGNVRRRTTRKQRVVADRQHQPLREASRPMSSWAARAAVRHNSCGEYHLYGRAISPASVDGA